MNIMNGYLSYTLAALAVVGGVAAYLLNYVDSQTALNMIWGGMAVFGLRRAIN